MVRTSFLSVLFCQQGGLCWRREYFGKRQVLNTLLSGNTPSLGRLGSVRSSHHRVHPGSLLHQALSGISLRNEGNMVPVLEAPHLVEMNRLNTQCDEA